MTSCKWQISWTGSSEWHLHTTLSFIGYISCVISIDLISSPAYFIIIHSVRMHIQIDLTYLCQCQKQACKKKTNILHGKSSCVCRCLTKLWLVYMLIGTVTPGRARKVSVLAGAESGKLFTSRLCCLWSGYGQVLWNTKVVSAGVLSPL